MELHYKEYGSQGPCLIILHGLFGSLDNWHSLARRFSQFSRVYAVDQRNHGHSPHAEGNDYHTMADDVLELIDRLDIDTAILLGHSMGGKTAMQFAFSYPERVQRLIVADIAPKTYASRHSDEIEAMMAINLNGISKRSDADDQMKRLIPDFGVRQFLLKNLTRDGQGAYKWKINLEELIRSYPSILASVESYVPFEKKTLFLKGENSKYIQEEDREPIIERFPNATIRTIAGAGHWLHAEKPDEFFVAVEGFIKD